MTNVSSQDFRNTYEEFYDRLRLYLWPFNVLKDIAQVEVDIYTAFLDLEKLDRDLTKLYSSIKEVAKDDSKLQKHYDELRELLDLEEPNFYHLISKVDEVDPEQNKVFVKELDSDKEEEGALI